MKKKIKPLMPSLREKKRYMAFEIIGKKDIPFTKVDKAITDKVISFLGEKYAAEAGTILLKDCYKDNKGIIRHNAKYSNEIRASLALIKEQNTLIRSLGLSGILKKAKKHISS